MLFVWSILYIFVSLIWFAITGFLSAVIVYLKIPSDLSSIVGSFTTFIFFLIGLGFFRDKILFSRDKIPPSFFKYSVLFIIIPVFQYGIYVLAHLFLVLRFINGFFVWDANIYLRSYWNLFKTGWLLFAPLFAVLFANWLCFEEKFGPFDEKKKAKYKGQIKGEPSSFFEIYEVIKEPVAGQIFLAILSIVFMLLVKLIVRIFIVFDVFNFHSLGGPIIGSVRHFFDIISRFFN